MERQTVCLCMIVKDESHIIKQTLEHLLTYIPFDYWAISDTGSTDGTQQIIRDFFKERNIPGELSEIPWRDFGYNRTKAFELAYNKSDYVFVWDADDLIEGEFRLPLPLTADAYKFTFANEGGGGIAYTRPQLFNNRKRWKYTGVLHEYAECCEQCGPNVVVKGNFHFVSRRLGARNRDPDKYLKDAWVLERALTEEPKNERYMFYCGQSYNCANRPDQAIKWYKARADAGGWIEEQYVSCYEIGHQYKKKGDMASAIFWWMDGWNRLPTRGECLYEIVKYYREAGKFRLAKMFVEQLKQIRCPTEGLFVKPEVHAYLLDYEMSILSYYLHEPLDHRRYLNLLNRGEYIQNCLSNYKFYAKKLKDIGGVDRDFSEKLERELMGRTDRFQSSSPCIIPDGEGYLMNIRYVNYNIGPHGSYDFRHSDGKITTLNKTCWLDGDFNILRTHWFSDVTQDASRYYGVEDVRLFRDGERVRFIGVRENPANCGPCVGAGVYDTDAVALTSTPLKSPYGRDCEKNWLYFHDGYGNLRILYEWNPITVADASGVILSKGGSVPLIFSRLRGSAGPSRIGDELWFLGHIVEYASPRHYYHIIIILDANTLALKRYSIPFKFHGDPIEYALGFIVEPERIILSYSRWDRSSAVMTIPRDVVERELF